MYTNWAHYLLCYLTNHLCIPYTDVANIQKSAVHVLISVLFLFTVFRNLKRNSMDVNGASQA